MKFFILAAGLLPLLALAGPAMKYGPSYNPPPTFWSYAGLGCAGPHAKLMHTLNAPEGKCINTKQ